MNKDLAFAFGFITLILAAFLAGILAHEAFHVIAMDDPHSITIHFGSIAGKLVSICCLTENESSNEPIAYFIQSIVLVAYFLFGLRILMEAFKND